MGCAGDLYDADTCPLHLPEIQWNIFRSAQEIAGSFPDMRGVLINNHDRFIELIRFLPTNWDVDFTGASFEIAAPFDHLRLGRARFDNARFTDRADFTAVEANEMSFIGASFDDDLVLSDAVVAGRFTISDCAIRGAWDANGARFSKPVTWRQLEADAITLDNAVFEARVDIAAATGTMSLTGAEFGSGVILRLSQGEVALEGALLGGPSLIASDGGGTPKVRSLADVDVSTLTVHGTDLSECAFGSVHNLDRIRLSEVTFGVPPGLRTERRVIAEEALWRAQHGNAAWAYMPQVGAGAAEHPAAIAGVYRSLRKAVEDAKDEPGATDFYFGEMEMRRAARRTAVHGIQLASLRALADYGLLTMYWLLAGYGLRGWRAFAALILMLAVGAVLLATVGFPVPKTTYEPTHVTSWGTLIYQPSAPPDNTFAAELPRGIRLAGQSVLSLLSPPAHQLTSFGEWVVLSLRFFGPVLVGLLILAVRNKLKR
jgi:hypothetical protein